MQRCDLRLFRVLSDYTNGPTGFCLGQKDAKQTALDCQLALDVFRMQNRLCWSAKIPNLMICTSSRNSSHAFNL